MCFLIEGSESNNIVVPFNLDLGMGQSCTTRGSQVLVLVSFSRVPFWVPILTHTHLTNPRNNAWSESVDKSSFPIPILTRPLCLAKGQMDEDIDRRKEPLGRPP